MDCVTLILSFWLEGIAKLKYRCKLQLPGFGPPWAYRDSWG